MLALKKKVTRNAAGTELYIEYVDATGLYNVTTNPGGFGAPNPERNTLAILFLGNHKKVEADIPCVPNAYDPITAPSLTIPITREVQGHLNYSLFAVPVFIPMGMYVDDDIVYDVVNPSAPFVKKMIGGIWIPKTTADLLLESTIVQTEGNAFPVAEVEAYVNYLAAEQLKKLRAMINGECGADEFEPLRNSYDYVNGLLYAATQNFCIGAYGEAQINIEEALRYQDIQLAA